MAGNAYGYLYLFFLVVPTFMVYYARKEECVELPLISVYAFGKN